MTMTTHIRGKLLVEKVIEETGEVIAKAVRGNAESSWFVGVLVDGKMVNVMEVYPHITEIKQRKLILDLMERLPFSLY